MLVAGPLVAWIVGALEGAVVVGGVSAIGAGLFSIGVPKDSVLEYEVALKTDRFLLLVHGTADEAARARDILKSTHPAELHTHPLKRAEQQETEPVLRSDKVVMPMMRQRVVPLLAPPLAKESCRKLRVVYETKARGMAVLTTPLLNKGTAFTAEEREALGLTGLLPPVISTLEAQVTCAYAQYQRLPDALSKNIYLTALHDRNEVLFFRLLSEHLREMIPIVNDRTVGLAMEQYHHECRRPRGVYLSIDHADAIEEAFRNLGAGPDDIDLILATDAEQIFGIGDWGVGGIEISIGKLAIYTAAGGIDPTRVIPVMLDVGTNRESSARPIRCIRGTGMRGSAENATTPSSTPTSRPPRSCFRMPCCNGKILGPATDAASSRNIAARSARSVTICRAPARSRWRPRFPRCASVERCCAISASSFSAQASPASASPT